MSAPGRPDGEDHGEQPEARPARVTDPARSGDACDGAEVFALRVIGHSMAPEFNEGEIIVIEPGGALRDGSYVLARLDDGWIFRQLRAAPDGGWLLHALAPAWPDLPIAGLEAVHGVVIQKAVPGRRRLSKSYL